MRKNMETKKYGNLWKKYGNVIEKYGNLSKKYGNVIVSIVYYRYCALLSDECFHFGFSLPPK
jgi:hypothetical protein